MDAGAGAVFFLFAAQAVDDAMIAMTRSAGTPHLTIFVAPYCVLWVTASIARQPSPLKRGTPGTGCAS